MSYERIRHDPPMESALAASVDRLTAEYHGVFSEETVRRAVNDSWEQLTSQATLIPPFFPTLVERFARDQLRAAAQVEELLPKLLPEVLFVCEHNAGRSQMAAGLAHQLGGDQVEVRCAGSKPGEHIYPAVTEAMSEIGIDITQEFPKPLTDVVVRAADVVITMGCGDSCPVYPGKRYQDWDIPDPAGQPIEVVRVIRDEIKAHVTELLEALTTVPVP